MAEELERQEADRKLQAEKLKNKMEVRKWVIWVIVGTLWVFCGHFVEIEFSGIVRSLEKYYQRRGIGGQSAVGFA